MWAYTRATLVSLPRRLIISWFVSHRRRGAARTGPASASHGAVDALRPAWFNQLATRHTADSSTNPYHQLLQLPLNACNNNTRPLDTTRRLHFSATAAGYCRLTRSFLGVIHLPQRQRQQQRKHRDQRSLSSRRPTCLSMPRFQRRVHNLIREGSS